MVLNPGATQTQGQPQEKIMKSPENTDQKKGKTLEKEEKRLLN